MLTQKLIDDEMNRRFEDILVMYTAGITARMDKNYKKSMGWISRAEQAAFQWGMESDQYGHAISFGIPRLDRSYIQGQKKAVQASEVFNLESDEFSSDLLPKSA